MSAKRRCAGCNKVITGRADRIWCSDACRVRIARNPNGNVRARGPVETVIRGTNGKLIAAVARLGYLGSPDDDVLDITYGKGGWWTHYRPRRLVAHDLHTLDGVDFRDLPEADASRRIVCFDPPYISTGNRGTSTVDEFYERFGLGELAGGWRATRQLIDAGLAECARILKPRGYLLVKCMNYVESGHKVWNTLHVAGEAERLGLELKDWFIHLTGGGPQVTTNLDGSPREQQHAREVTSTLFVFTKGADR